MKFSGEVGLGARNNLENWGWGGGVMFISLDTGFTFLGFHGNLCLLAILRENGWTDVHEFSAKVGHEPSNNLANFRDVAVYPLNPGSIFFYFLDSCFLVTLWKKNGERIFMKFLGNGWHYSRNNELDCLRPSRLFHGSHLSAAACLLATLW